MALRERREGVWRITTQVLNTGRLDVSIVGYTAWVEATGRPLQRLRKRISIVRKVGFAHARNAFFIFSSSPVSIHVGHASELADGDLKIKLPYVLKAGAMVEIPSVGLGWEENAKLRPRVAIHLGSGSIVRAWVIPVDAFDLKPINYY